MGCGAGNAQFREVPIGDLMAEFHDGPHATPKPASSGPVFLGIKNISVDGRLDLSTIRHIDDSDFPRWTRRVTPETDDIVFTYEATLHRYALIPAGFRGCLGRRLALVRPRREIVDPRFLHLALRGPEWRRTIEDRVISGATVDRVPLIDFPSFPISIPPLDVQTRIAAILGAFDDIIEINERRIDLLEELARAVYREWFVRFRIPGHALNGEMNPKSVMPSGWDLVPLNELVSTQYGYTTSAVADPVGPRFLRGMDINKRSFIDWSEVPHCTVPDNRVDGFRLNVGDVCVIRMADPGKVGIVERPVDAVFASYLVRLRSIEPRVPPYLLFHHLDASEYQSWISGSSTGSTRKSASAAVLTEPRVLVPPLEIAKRFDEHVSGLRGQLTALVEVNASLARARDLLLPRLVTGRLDISDIDLQDLLPEAAAA